MKSVGEYIDNMGSISVGLAAFMPESDDID